MSFRNIDNSIKSTYKTSNDNLVSDFYNIVLSEAILYDRITGFFNSTSLAVVAKGLVNFIDHQGKMRLLCGSELTEDDLNSIINAEDLKNLINKKFLSDIENIEDKIIDNHVKILGWMVANNYLDIKIGIKKNNSSYYGGMLHSKIGIFYDKEDNIISFDGSVNETYNGWINNIESLKVFKSWEDYKFMKDDLNDFERYWSNNDSSLEVLDIPEASKRKLIEIAPKNRSELNKLLLMSIKTNNNKKLYKHQEKAISSWFENDQIGIFEMATGTGKTFTSLKCIEKTMNNEDVLTVIACPYAHLAEQWKKEIMSLNIGNCYNFYGSANDNWKKQFERLILNYKLGLKFKNIIITTHKTFSSPSFINRIKQCNIKKLLIVDEMHHVGSSNYKLGLLPDYDYRLGLSATPSRFMDEEGTEYILKYFNKIVYQFTLKEALNKINPATNQYFLTPYNYHPIKIDLSYEELEEYKELSKKIARFSHITKLNDNYDNIKNLIIKRRNIINNAKNKYDTLRNTLHKLDHKEHLIIFCSDKQIKNVLKILKEEEFSAHKFTQKEKAKPSKKYGGLSEREMILNSFDNSNYQVLVAIKCLDEGVDVPSADQVILMSNTTNPIEYIQRRGRVLRRYPDKDIANIYDFSVIPEERDKYSINILKKESERLYDFVDNANNKEECYRILEKWGAY